LYRFGQTPVGKYTPEKHFWVYFPCGKTFPAILVRNSVKAKKEKTDKQTNRQTDKHENVKVKRDAERTYKFLS
jgi:hypothetical protein